MIRSSNDQKYKSLLLYETVVGVWVFYALVIPFSTDWIMIIQTIIFSYIFACLLLKESQRQIVQPLTSIFVLCIFRIDQMIMKTIFTKILTEITTQILYVVLQNGDTILLFILFVSFSIFQSSRMKLPSKVFTLVTFLVLVFVLFITSFSPSEVLLVDATTIQFEHSTRISIVDSCSGIYGLIIFISSYVFFVNVTKSNRIFRREQIISFGTMGIIGVYLLNLFRILALIFLSLHFPANIWTEVHIYLGGFLIIGYLAIFWGIIWTILPVRSST